MTIWPASNADRKKRMARNREEEEEEDFDEDGDEDEDEDEDEQVRLLCCTPMRTDSVGVTGW